MDFDENIEAISDNLEDVNINEEILLMDQDTSANYKSMKDCVIFLVDCGKSMIEDKHNGRTNAVNKILAVAESFLKTKVITNEKDLFGMILFNTQVTANDLNFEAVNRIIPITPPDAGLIKKIKILQQNTNPNLNKDYKAFLASEFGSCVKETSFLSNALWICHTELKSYDQKSFNRRIFLFTDNDNPMNENATERSMTIQRAKDMLDSEIVIELFPMNFNLRFDLRKFYCEIIPMTVDSNEDMMLTKESCENRLRELTKRIRQKEVKKRTLGKCPFYLTKSMKIMVNFYSTIKKATKGRIFHVDARTNKPLNTVSQAICKETGASLYQNQIGTFHSYGTAKVPFSKEEMKQIKTVDDPGLKLMGFKSFDSIKPYYNIRESYFLYPDEYLTSGASQLCDALVKQLISKNKVAIVKFVPREGANIKFCALVPQKEAFDEDYFQTPPGFNLIFLPYADDIRSNSDILKKINTGNENENVNVNLTNVHETLTNEESEIAKKLIKRMNINFDCRNFENPTIQKFYSTLQALALGESEVEKVDDLINPNNEDLLKVLEGTDIEFKNSLMGKGTVREFNDDTSSQPKKKASRKKNEEADEVKKKDNDEDNDDKKVVKTKTTKKRAKKDDGKMMIVEDEEKSEEKVTITSGRSKSRAKSKSKSKSPIRASEKDDNIEMEDSSKDKANNVYSNEVLLKDYEESGLTGYTVVQLKEICRMKGLKFTSKSKKNDMIQIIQDFLFSQIK